jgi:5'(3')-deoxyribonucleotidase
MKISGAIDLKLINSKMISLDTFLMNMTKKIGRNTMKSIVYIDMDDVLCDFKGAYQQARVDEPNIIYPQSQYGFYANLNPIPFGVESVKKLIDSDLYEPYILTAPSTKNPLCYTEKRIWVEKYFDLEFTEKLIISPNKSLLKGKYLIDDNATGRGQDGFEGLLIHFGSTEFPGWKAVMAFLNR